MFRYVKSLFTDTVETYIEDNENFLSQAFVRYTFFVHSIGLTSIDLIMTFSFYLLRQTSLLTRIVVCKGISEKNMAIFWENRTEKDHGGKRARYLSRQRDLTVSFFLVSCCTNLHHFCKRYSCYDTVRVYDLLSLWHTDARLTAKTSKVEIRETFTAIRKLRITNQVTEYNWIDAKILSILLTSLFRSNGNYILYNKYTESVL